MKRSYGGGHEGQEEGGHHGAKELGDDVDDTAEKGDVASDEGAEGDGGVHVTSGDVGADGDGNKKAECVGDGGGDETGRCGGAVVGKLVEGDAGTRAGEHEDEGGDELSQTRLQCVGVSGLLGPSDGDVSDRHLQSTAVMITTGERSGEYRSLT